MLFERSEFIECFEKKWFRPLSSGRFRTFLFGSFSFGDERKRILLHDSRPLLGTLTFSDERNE